MTIALPVMSTNLIIIIILFLVVLGALYIYWVLLNHRFSTVVKGRVYRSGTLHPARLQNKINQYGIRTVIDLRRDKQSGRIEAEKRFLEQLGVRHIHLRSTQVPKTHVIESFLNVMSNDEYYPILIHCTHGRGRAALFSAIYLMEYCGRSNMSTFVSLFWNPLLGSFNPLSRKGKFILNYTGGKAQKKQFEFLHKIRKDHADLAGD